MAVGKNEKNRTFKNFDFKRDIFEYNNKLLKYGKCNIDRRH